MVEKVQVASTFWKQDNLTPSFNSSNNNNRFGNNRFGFACILKTFRLFAHQIFFQNTGSCVNTVTTFLLPIFTSWSACVQDTGISFILGVLDFAVSRGNFLKRSLLPSLDLISLLEV